MSEPNIAHLPLRSRVPFAILGFCIVILCALVLLVVRARSLVNQVPLSSMPKGVTSITAKESLFRPSRRYVGYVAPWLEARVGPQFTSSYVDTVLVRPGDVVKRGQVLATLDCRNASEQSKALAMQARALSATQEALAKETSRVSGLLSLGFVSPNEMDRRVAEGSSKQAEMLAAKSRLARASLEVDDCVLRAPFDGEVADRLLDPGAFARPSASVLSIIDREQVRILLDVPETDFEVVAVGREAQIRLLSTGGLLSGHIARRNPAAEPGTRTIHAEIDLPDAKRSIPVSTTAEVILNVGEPLAASEIPLLAASMRGDLATIFVVDGEVARKRRVSILGESEGRLFIVRSELRPGSAVVTEGRALLQDGERILNHIATSSEDRP